MPGSAVGATAARAEYPIKRIIFASGLGTMIEWYDFYIFGSLAVIMSELMFPKGDPAWALIKTWALFATGTFRVGAARAFQMPAMAALLPSLVPRELFPRAIASNSVATQSAVIAGPAIGGLVYVAGPAAVYATSVPELQAPVV